MAEIDKVSDIFLSRATYRALENPARRLLFFITTFLKKKNIRCGVYFLSDSAMKKLNMRFKKKNCPATVLSFVADPSFPHPDIKKNFKHVGEIYLAPDYIRRVKKDKVSRYLLHGFLHLSGYTHVRSCDRIQMEALEEKIVKFLVMQKKLPDFF